MSSNVLAAAFCDDEEVQVCNAAEEVRDDGDDDDCFPCCYV